MAAEIVTPDKTQLPAGPATLPAGWRRTGDGPTSEKKYLRRATFRGVRTSLDAALAAVVAFYGDNLLAASAGPSGAGAAEITADWSASLGTAGGANRDNEPVAPDTYQLEPVVVPTALEAHPAFSGVAGDVESIRDAFSHGELGAAAALADISGAAAQRYYALLRAGVTQWESIGYVWRVTRHYSTRADLSGIAAAAAIANANRVYAWANVEGHARIPEPKWTYQTAAGTISAAMPFEWRLSGPTVSRTAEALDLSYSYAGAWKWAAALYPGGTWAPPSS